MAAAGRSHGHRILLTYAKTTLALTLKYQRRGLLRAEVLPTTN
jgi:hypothetical protein